MKTEEEWIKAYEKPLKDFENWILQNPKFPRNINKLLLLRFLKVYDFDMEAAKKLYVIFLKKRKKHSNIFKNRDLLSQELQAAMSSFQIVYMKKLTKENNNITIFKMTPSDTKYSTVEIIRLILAFLDYRFIQCDENELINGDVCITDLSNLTLSRFKDALFHLGTVKAFLEYSQEAAPIRIVQNHYVNCPPIMHKFMTMIGPFLGPQIKNTMVFHTTLETLHDYIPKDLLPADFGGTCEPIDKLYENAKQKVMNYRDYLLCDDNWKLKD